MTRNKVTLESLFNIGSSKRVLKSQWTTEGVPFYRGREITSLAKDGYVDNELFISEALFSDYSKKYGAPKSGDIVITAIGTIGNSYIVQEHDRFYFKDASVLWLNKKADVSSEYINLWLKSSLFTEQLDEGNGATVDTLTIKKLQSITVNLPAISEQQRIVAILDQAFEGIAKARANAQQNLLNARALLESHLQSTFTNNVDDWKAGILGDVCEELFAGGDVPKDNSSKIKSEKFNIPIFSNGEKNKGLYGFTNVPRVAKPSITVSARGTIGYSEIRYEPFYPAIRLIVVTPKTDVLDLFFLKYLISNIDFIHSGTSIPQLTVPMIKGYLIKFPIIEVQKRIIKKLDELSAETQYLEALYQRKIELLDELKKSLLQQAFAGEL
jgi:type I restriction enzyme S subunit